MNCKKCKENMDKDLLIFGEHFCERQQNGMYKRIPPQKLEYDPEIRGFRERE